MRPALVGLAIVCCALAFVPAAGVTRWVVVTTAVVVAAYRLAAALLPTGDWPLRVLATGLLAQAVAAGVVTWLGWAGVLSATTQFLAVGFLTALAARLPNAPPGEPPADPGRLGWAGLAVGGLASAQSAVDVVRYLPVDADNMWYHFPMVAEWVRTGSIRPIDAVPTIAKAYPGFREAVMTFLAVPVGHEHLAVPGVWEVPLFGLAVARLAVGLGVPGPAAWAAGGYAAAVPQTVLAGTGNDLALAIGLTAAVLFLVRFTADGRRGDAILAGAALGTLAATKYSGVIYAGLLVGAFAAADLLARRWRIGSWLLAAAVAAALAGPWYGRNLLVFGNPLYPAEVAPGGVKLFPGPFPPGHFAPSTLGWNVRPLIDHADHFRQAFGWLVPLIGLAAVIGLGGLLTRAGRRIWPVFVLPAALFVLFLHQPFNRPSFGFDYNMRYLLTWFGVTLAVAVWTVRFGGANIAAGVLVVGAIATVTGWSVWWPIFAAAAGGAALVGPWLGRVRLPSNIVLLLIGLAVIAAGFGLDRLRGRNQYAADYGYRDAASSRGWGAVARFVHERLTGERVAVVGDDRFFPFYGDRFGNAVVLVIPTSPPPAKALAAARAAGATVLVCLNQIARRELTGHFWFELSVGAELVGKPGVEVLFESDGAYVLRLRPD